jgi:HD-like signal output (HDOD) protein
VKLNRAAVRTPSPAFTRATRERETQGDQKCYVGGMSESVIEGTLRAELVETFDDPDYRPPPLPSVAIKLWELTRDQRSDVGDIVRLLEQDQMLAGMVLRIVSSPFYAARTPIRSLHQAVVRVGLKTLQSIVFEASLRRGIFTLPDFRETVEQVLRHSTTSAYITKVLCASSGIDPESGFLCALLHDIGFSALLFSVSSRNANLELRDVWTELDGMHERASKIVARLWSLPPEICEVVGNHHHLARSGKGESARVAAAVCIADALTEQFGANIVGPLDADGGLMKADHVAEGNVEAARALLGIDDAKLAGVVETAEQIVPDILWV